jgi:hypothetical protein
MEENPKEYKVKLGKLEITILIISGLIILFSFIAPSIFVNNSTEGLNFTKSGQIGDTIGGIMNPFIALAGVLLTFLAFFIQYRANKLQRDLFKEELDEQRQQFRKTQFENQFYEMLRLHKENVNEVQIELINYKTDITTRTVDKTIDIVKGKRVFEFLKEEFEICYYVAEKNFPKDDYKVWVNEAYGVFFHGLFNKDISLHNFFKDLNNLKTAHQKSEFKKIEINIKSVVGFDLMTENELLFKICNGYSYQLSHYYRHLFQTVKFVANQEESFISYEEKRKYLRILRAQLSNQEQTMLLYNWLSSFGKQWENEKNKYFTDFRMIHNLYQELLADKVTLTDIFDIDNNYRKEKNREFDPLFEFQDWKK